MYVPRNRKRKEKSEGRVRKLAFVAIFFDVFAKSSI